MFRERGAAYRNRNMSESAHQTTFCCTEDDVVYTATAPSYRSNASSRLHVAAIRHPIKSDQPSSSLLRSINQSINPSPELAEANTNKLCRLYCLYRPLQVLTWKATQSFRLGGHWSCHMIQVFVFRHVCAVTFEVTGMNDDQVWSSWPFQLPRYGWFSVTALSDLVTLTFDLLNFNGVTIQSCHALPSCLFSACYALPFST